MTTYMKVTWDEFHRDAQALADRIAHAGAIFIGRHTPEAIGDYVAGTNHVLPTSRAARFSGGLGVGDFLKRTSIVSCTPESLAVLGPVALALAEAGAHAVLLDRNKDGIESAAAEITAMGRRALPIAGDVTDIAHIDGVFATVDREFGQVDILGNVAEWTYSDGDDTAAKSRANNQRNGGLGGVVSEADPVGVKRSRISIV